MAKPEISYEIFTDANCTFGKRIAYQKVDSIPSSFGDIRRNANAFADRVKAGQLLPIRPDWSAEELRAAVPVAPGTDADGDVYHVVPVFLRMKVTNGTSRNGATSASSDLDALFGELPAATTTDDLGF